MYSLSQFDKRQVWTEMMSQGCHKHAIILRYLARRHYCSRFVQLPVRVLRRFSDSLDLKIGQMPPTHSIGGMP